MVVELTRVCRDWCCWEPSRLSEVFTPCTSTGKRRLVVCEVNGKSSSLVEYCSFHTAGRFSISVHIIYSEFNHQTDILSDFKSYRSLTLNNLAAIITVPGISQQSSRLLHVILVCCWNSRKVEYQKVMGNIKRLFSVGYIGVWLTCPSLVMTYFQ